MGDPDPLVSLGTLTKVGITLHEMLKPQSRIQSLRIGQTRSSFYHSLSHLTMAKSSLQYQMAYYCTALA